MTVAVGTQKDLKLLGVPCYEPGTDRKSGDLVSEATATLLDSWNCKGSIVNMVFDTTASNTGHISDACIKIQESCDKALLLSGCRHHVGEVILTHVFKDLDIEVSKSPAVTVFQRFRKNFDMLPHKDEVLSQIDTSSYSEDVQLLVKQWMADLLPLLQSELNLKRDDYREFVELCLVFLGAEDTVTFRKPGALHKARWMAKLLYSLKICLLECEIQKLPAGTITTRQQLPKLRDFVNFATLVYSSWWLSAGSAVDAPYNDLLLYQQIILKYRAVNQIVSDSALSAFNRHLWYLTSELVPIALFSGKVPAEQRHALALSLLATKPESPLPSPENRFGNGFGKPKFPERITESTVLSDLVAEDSWYTMGLLQIDTTFLEEPVDSWSELPEYQASLANINSLNVINDCAERGVKLSSDFLSAARSEDHYQNVLQVVEEDRRSRPNLRKRKAKTDK